MAVFSFPSAVFLSLLALQDSSAWQPVTRRRQTPLPRTATPTLLLPRPQRPPHRNRRSNILLSLRSSSSSSSSSEDNGAATTTKKEETTKKKKKKDDDELPTLHLFNSKTRQKHALVPVQQPGRISMYTCGPTVYDFAHVGNFRAFLTYDLVKRVLQYFGYDVTHVCNLTDVDDKILQRAAEQQLEHVSELTLKYEAHFLDDLKALNIRPATHYPRATQHIDDMMEMILLLRDKGLAYETSDGSWYFDTQAQPGYGTHLVPGGLNFDDMESAADRNDLDSEKKHFADFCLWKAFKPDGLDREDAAWSSESIQKGRPGWHLECSAMARHFFGADQTIDLHGGGVDLQFPHHENEIAQSEGCCDNNVTFCNCWFHNGFVNIGNEKMSKSLGNFLTLRTACPTALQVRAYRYLVLSSQYRNPLAFTDQAMRASQNAITRIDKLRHRLQQALHQNNDDTKAAASSSVDSDIAQTRVPAALANFEAAIQDDLSMPRAAAALFTVVKVAEAEFKRVAAADAAATLDLVGLQAVWEALHQMDKVFGIFYTVPAASGGEPDTDDDDDNEEDSSAAAVVPDEVLQLVSERSVAKEAKDWELADSLRSRITELGFAVKDVKGGEPIVTRM